MDINPTIQPQQTAIDQLHQTLRNQQAGAKVRSALSANGTGASPDLSDERVGAVRPFHPPPRATRRRHR